MILVDGKPLVVTGDVKENAGISFAYYVRTETGYNVTISCYENGVRKERKYAHIISK